MNTYEWNVRNSECLSCVHKLVYLNYLLDRLAYLLASNLNAVGPRNSRPDWDGYPVCYSVCTPCSRSMYGSNMIPQRVSAVASHNGKSFVEVSLGSYMHPIGAWNYHVVINGASQRLSDFSSGGILCGNNSISVSRLFGDASGVPCNVSLFSVCCLTCFFKYRISDFSPNCSLCCGDCCGDCCSLQRKSVSATWYERCSECGHNKRDEWGYTSYIRRNWNAMVMGRSCCFHQVGVSASLFWLKQNWNMNLPFWT